MIRLGILISSVLLLSISGCIGVGYECKPPEKISDAKIIYIVKNTDTRDSFLKVMENWLLDKGYEVKILNNINDMYQHEWTLTYTGKWSWDFAIYLSDAKISAFEYGKLKGESSFQVNGGGFNINPGKWNDGEYRVNKMMDNLFNKPMKNE